MTADRRKYSNLGETAWIVFAAFGTYFCMYAFRKPFTVLTSDEQFFGIPYKTFLVTAQILGYTASKFLGIRWVAETPPEWRTRRIIGLIAVAELALLMFAVTPAPFGVVWLFINGLPLGMVFGLVLGGLEGRQLSELFVAGLCASFIVADGAVKSAGQAMLDAGVAQAWMPAATGGLFVVPLLICVGMLSRIPSPTDADQLARSPRMPMKRRDRQEFFRQHAVGLVLITVAYMLVTVLRSFRADFAKELWSDLGVSTPPAIFTRSELVVAAGVVTASSLFVFIRDNRWAFGCSMVISAVSLLTLGLTQLGLAAGWISPFAFMVLTGLGLYTPYVAVHTTVLERLVSVTRARGNVTYLMYLVDAWGYLAYIALLAVHSFGPQVADYLGFYERLVWTGAILGSICLLGSQFYFARQRTESV